MRNRRSCTDSQTAIKLVFRTKRAGAFPGLNNEQVVEIADFTWRGQLFPKTLHLMNYSVEFPRHYTGGYMVVSAGRSCSRRCVHAWMQLQKQVLALLLDVQPDAPTHSVVTG